ncbi:ribosomal protein L12e [Perkinsela sp. CCAP 1560/4]|nr:ribosomal protein L12e [Perkinsela sp. CCAP 1560/4]|eukprot:KNH04222.1 ribosomal protein L12e [Perkinsela sp. CCAP 1560/4]
MVCHTFIQFVRLYAASISVNSLNGTEENFPNRDVFKSEHLRKNGLSAVQNYISICFHIRTSHSPLELRDIQLAEFDLLNECVWRNVLHRASDGLCGAEDLQHGSGRRSGH